MILMFLLHVKKFKGKQFIIVGSNIGSVKRNILREMEDYLGIRINLSKSNSFMLFGNEVTVFQGANADCWKSIRGFTSHGTLINEATAQHEDTIKECFDRTSGKGAKVFADTNTENPYHAFKKNYIDKNGIRDDNDKLQVMVEHFTMFDNTTLSKEYIDRQLAIYEEGSISYLREIMGVWVAKEGCVYNSFRRDIHLIKSFPPETSVVKYIAGVDWGYEHHGSIVVIAKTTDGRYVVVDSIAEQHKDIEFWKEKAKEFKDRYNIGVFYCDSARPEYVQAFNLVGLKAINADKTVIEGISLVQRLLISERLLFIEDRFIKGTEEMFQYVWKGGVSEDPVKMHDDVLDSLRYAIKTEDKLGAIQDSYTTFKPMKARVIGKKDNDEYSYGYVGATEGKLKDVVSKAYGSFKPMKAKTIGR